MQQALAELAAANERDAGARAGGSGLQVSAHEELHGEVVCVDCLTLSSALIPTLPSPLTCTLNS